MTCDIAFSRYSSKTAALAALFAALALGGCQSPMYSGTPDDMSYSYSVAPASDPSYVGRNEAARRPAGRSGLDGGAAVRVSRWPRPLDRPRQHAAVDSAAARYGPCATSGSFGVAEVCGEEVVERSCPTGPTRRDHRRCRARRSHRRAADRTRPGRRRPSRPPPSWRPARDRSSCRSWQYSHSVGARAVRAKSCVALTSLSTPHTEFVAPEGVAAATAGDVDHGRHQIGPLRSQRQRRPPAGRNADDEHARRIDERLPRHEVDGGADILRGDDAGAEMVGVGAIADRLDERAAGGAMSAPLRQHHGEAAIDEPARQPVVDRHRHRHAVRFGRTMIDDDERMTLGDAAGRAEHGGAHVRPMHRHSVSARTARACAGLPDRRRRRSTTASTAWPPDRR